MSEPFSASSIFYCCQLTTKMEITVTVHTYTHTHARILRSTPRCMYKQTYSSYDRDGSGVNKSFKDVRAEEKQLTGEERRWRPEVELGASRDYYYDDANNKKKYDWRCVRDTNQAILFIRYIYYTQLFS